MADRKVQRAIQSTQTLIEEAKKAKRYEKHLKLIAWNIANNWESFDDDRDTQYFLFEMMTQVIEAVEENADATVYFPDGNDLLSYEETERNAVSFVKTNYRS